MELEVGMYVRTKDGYISKCIYYDNELENIYGFDSTVRKSFGDTYDFIYCNEQKEHITKASHNIIDLIEVGDYVNGYRVDFVENIDSPIITIKKVFCEEYTKDLYSKTFNIKDIKLIVTKEQMEAIQYVVK